MRRYNCLLPEIGEWLVRMRAMHEDSLRCSRGCARCYHGLFDVSFPDALLVAHGFRSLPEHGRRTVAVKAAEIQARIAGRVPEFKSPYLLKMEDDALIDRVIACIPSPRCPFLDPGGLCLVYPYRPLVCRLEGIPMVDDHDGLFGDWCELNFVEGVTEEAQGSLQWDYYGLQDAERASTRELSESLLGERQEALTVFIPSIIVEYEQFWAPLLEKISPADLESPATGNPTGRVTPRCLGPCD